MSHIVGKVYDMNQTNGGKLVAELEAAQARVNTLEAGLTERDAEIAEAEKAYKKLDEQYLTSAKYWSDQLAELAAATARAAQAEMREAALRECLSDAYAYADHAIGCAQGDPVACDCWRLEAQAMLMGKTQKALYAAAVGMAEALERVSSSPLRCAICSNGYGENAEKHKVACFVGQALAQWKKAGGS